jgi:type IV secretion system protein VirD4
MSDKPSPTDRLNARLAALASTQPTSAPAPTTQASALDGLATKYITIAEDYFSDPVEIIRAKWTRQKPDPFIFSRAAHQFSDYEAFVFKLVLVLAGMGMIDRDLAQVLTATATYAEGKAKVERDAPPLIGHQFANYHRLSQNSDGDEIPTALAHHAHEINSLIQTARSSASGVLRAWIAKHIGASPHAAPATSSALFTDTQGPFTLPLGIQADGRPLYYKGEASLLTVAPPGKGKTQCHILPTLASYQGPVIVLDIKGECYANTADWRRRNVGPVWRFNPVEPETSARYNPIAFVDDDPDEVWQSARFLAELLVLVRSQNDSTWESQGKDLLTLIIAYVTAMYEPHERTMVQVLDLVATIGLSDMLTMVSGPTSPFPGAMRRVAARFAQMASAAPKQFEGVLSGASQHLQVWEGPKVERTTAAADWKPEDFRGTPCPTLYLCIPPDAIETYAPVLRVIIGQHVRRLMRNHDRSHAPILFLLDELPRLGKMDPIREALEVGRSYGIKLWMVAQYPEQLTQAYPGVGDGMMESCDVRMYMNPSSATADKIAKAFGSSNNVLSKSSKPNLEATEIMGPVHRDSIFVLASNEQPVVLRKRFFYK